MCGIGGYVGPGPGPETAAALLQRMADALRHRGPDEGGVIAGVGYGLCHRRLSVIDIAEGQQPMEAGGDAGLTISYNGEIFNYVELRQLLIERGHHFRTASDTEVILELYRAFGVDCVTRLNGDFAFALWDGRERRMLLARDRVGVRPLFHMRQGGTIYFASEVGALLQVPGFRAELDPVALDQIFTFWAPLSPRTAFKDVSELPPGHLMLVEAGKVEIRPYWQLRFPEDPRDGDGRPAADIAEELSSLLTDATRIRLRADVEVGSYLSGGVDSSIVSALAARLAPGRLRTYSVTFDDPAYDESGPQQTMAAALGTRHRSALCGAAEIAPLFPTVVRHAEQPILRTAPAPLYRLAGLVREDGIKVVLSGEGADEVFAGYDLFKEVAIRRFAARQPTSRLRPLLFRRLYPYLAGLSRQTPEALAAFFGTQLDREGDPLFSHRPRMRSTGGAKLFFSAELKDRLAGSDAGEALAAQLPEAFGRWHPLHQAQYIEATTLLPGYILSSQGDRMAMAHGVETRFPFLDHRVIEFAARIPPALKLRGLREKHILREAFKPLLPPSIGERTKQPYRAPESRSFAGPERVAEIDNAMSGAAIRDAGLFDAEKVARLAEKAGRSGLDSFRDNAAYVGILSTQLWSQQFAGLDASRQEQTDHSSPRSLAS